MPNFRHLPTLGLKSLTIKLMAPTENFYKSEVLQAPILSHLFHNNNNEGSSYHF
jgi:hypothetical protein